MVSYSIDSSSRTPFYKQLVRLFEAFIRTGQLKDGEIVPSMNELAAHLDISKETVKKAYYMLRDKGLLEPCQGKGFFIRQPQEGRKTSVVFIIDMLSNYKQVLIESFMDTIGDRANVTLLLHNQNPSLLEFYIDKNLGQYDYYVIMPHFSLEPQVQKRVCKAIARIPNRQLILADHWIKSLPGNYGAVYQDFETDYMRGLVPGLRRIKKCGKLQIIVPEGNIYSPTIAVGMEKYLQTMGIETEIYSHVETETVVKGSVFLFLGWTTEGGLVDLVRIMKEKKLKVRKDVRIISFNEAPICEILLGGLTTISTDFPQMGRLIAQMILRQKMSKVKCNFKMTRRASF